MKNGFTYEKNGWKYIFIEGTPKKRGHAYGVACAKDFIEIQKMLKFFIYESYGKTWDFFIEKINNSHRIHAISPFIEIEKKLNTLWMNIGNSLSRAYTGSNSLKSEIIHQGYQDFHANIKTFIISVQRVYMSAFHDQNRQHAVSLSI